MIESAVEIDLGLSLRGRIPGRINGYLCKFRIFITLDFLDVSFNKPHDVNPKYDSVFVDPFVSFSPNGP